jgi:hypothetical protein
LATASPIFNGADVAIMRGAEILALVDWVVDDNFFSHAPGERRSNSFAFPGRERAVRAARPIRVLPRFEETV